jgi:hypothetical protein
MLIKQSFKKCSAIHSVSPLPLEDINTDIDFRGPGRRTKAGAVNAASNGDHKRIVVKRPNIRAIQCIAAKKWIPAVE